jgi:hypothetical protein
MYMRVYAYIARNMHVYACIHACRVRVYAYIDLNNLAVPCHDEVVNTTTTVCIVHLTVTVCDYIAIAVRMGDV